MPLKYVKKARGLTTQLASQRADWVWGGRCIKLKIKEGSHAVDWPTNARAFAYNTKTESIFIPQKFDKD